MCKSGIILLDIASVLCTCTGDALFAALDEVEERGGVLSVVLLKSCCCDVEGIEIVYAVVSVEGDTAGSGFDIGFAHRYDSISAVVGDDLRDTEKFLVVMRVCVIDYTEELLVVMRVSVVNDTEKLVYRQHEVRGYLFYKGNAVCLLSKAEQQTDRVVDDPSVEVDDLG